MTAIIIQKKQMLMKRIITQIICCIMYATAMAQTTDCRILSKANGSITFEVDKDLPKPTEELRLWDADVICREVLGDFQIPREQQNIITHSIAPGRKLVLYGEDVVYRMLCWAYAEHRPVALSPDVVWLLISQTFGRYVNQNAEQLRSKIVKHDGVKELTIVSNFDLLGGGASATAWNTMLNGFSKQIEYNTQGNIAKVMTCDFSTSTLTSRIASQITLMEAVKQYFRYEVRYSICGIPSVTLHGTAADWQRVLEKTEALTAYDMGWWVESLRPILKEFVAAAKGKPRRDFWLDMITKYHPDQLRGLGCLSTNVKDFDGWFLTFFPTIETKSIPKKSGMYDHMASEVVSVNMKYKRIGRDEKDVIDETDLELYAGFFGASADPKTGALTPEIGWMVRNASTDESTARFIGLTNDNLYVLQAEEVLPVMPHLSHFVNLQLTFDGKVTLPAWLDNVKIDNFTVYGIMTDNEAETLRRRFPNIKIVRQKYRNPTHILTAMPLTK